MKIRINGMQNEMILNQGNINILQIDNPKLFSHIVEILNDKANDIDNNEIILLDENNQEMDFYSKAYVLIDFFNIDFNSKKIISKIYDYIIKNIEISQNGFIDKINSNVRKKIINEITELPFNFNMRDTIEINDLLKIYNVRIDDLSCTCLLERIELLIEILSVLKISEILIIPNLKSYLSEDELVELYKYSLYNNVNLILLENRQFKKLKYERILSIDEEFDDFLS